MVLAEVAAEVAPAPPAPAVPDGWGGFGAEDDEDSGGRVALEDFDTGQRGLQRRRPAGPSRRCRPLTRFRWGSDHESVVMGNWHAANLTTQESGNRCALIQDEYVRYTTDMHRWRDSVYSPGLTLNPKH